MANEVSTSVARNGVAADVRAIGNPGARGAWRQRWRVPRIVSLSLLGALIHGCLYDSDDPCSPGQVILDDAVCVCADGSALTDRGCIPCGENEVAGSGACVCAAGFSRTSEGAPCAAEPSLLGLACDTESAPCSDATYSLCHVSDGAGSAGYCTEACASSEDCDGSYACDTTTSSPYCRRPPTGTGLACATDADCAGNEASLCESFMLHACVVANCSPTAQDCFPGTKCCDFTAFGAPAPFCLPDGAC